MIFEVYTGMRNDEYICRNDRTINAGTGAPLVGAIQDYLSGNTYTIAVDGDYIKYFNKTKPLFTASSLEEAMTKYPEYFI